MIRLTCLAAIALTVLSIGATPAHAQSPVGCTGNSFTYQFNKDRTFIRDGETVNYSLKASNNAAGACDATTVTVRLQMPSAAGPPSAVFQNLTNRMSFAYPTPELSFGPYPFTPTFGAAPPDRYVAHLTTDADSVVHDTPAPFSPLNIDRVLQVLTVRPGLTIDKVGSTTGGPAPQNVVYTYTVKNVTLPAGLPDDVSQMQNVVPTDDLCSPMTLISGDTNGDRKMQVTETWAYTCSQSFPNPGVFTNTAKVCADEVADNVSMHYCSPPDTWTVTVTPPPATPATPTTPTTPSTPSTPATPQGAVLPAAQNNPLVAPAKCLATPSRVRVRAKELTTITIKVRGVGAGVPVTITGAGVKVTVRTDSTGTATARVRPTKTGTLVVSTKQCSGTQKVAVLSARKTAAQRVPRVTG